MDVTVTLDSRYQVAPDGSVWSHAGMAYEFWQRYLDAFDQVHVVARASKVPAAPSDWHPVTGPGVRFVGLPDFLGPLQYLERYRSIRSAIRAAAPQRGAVIMRVGSQIANVFEDKLHETGHPFALEVIGDPYDVFAPGVIQHPLRRFFRWHFSSSLKRQCAKAIGVAYVTRKALQARYPTPALSASVSDVDLKREALIETAATTHYSSIELDEDSIRPQAKQTKTKGSLQLVSVGSMAQMYKGFDVLIEAVSLILEKGLDVTLTIAGEGKFRQHLETLAAAKGIEHRIHFAGQVTPGQGIRDLLDSSDLFVLPSRTEGLPRALIEAMARALPCIGSHVGGIPELLESSEMVPPGDPVLLADKLHEVLQSPSRMEQLSMRNRQIALEYRDEILNDRRKHFYRHVRQSTLDWEAQKSV